MKRYVLNSVLVLIVGLAYLGCATQGPVRKPRGIKSGMTLKAATERAVEGIAADPRLKRFPDRHTIIVMDQVTNRTSDPTADFQIYLARIRSFLNQSGARNRLKFIESRNKMGAILQREGYPPSEHKRTRPDYALTAEFYDLPRRSGNFFLLTFQLVDFTNDQVTWEDSFEVNVRR